MDKEKARSLFEEAQKISWETRPPNVPHRAIALAEAALAEDPDFIKAAELLANDLRRANNYEKSIDMYKYALSRAYDKEPDNYKLLRNLLRDLGRVLILAQKYEEAINYLEKSLEIEYSSASEYLAEAYNKLGRHQEVINLYSHIEQVSEDGRIVDEPALHLGKAYKALGLKEKAIKVFEGGLRFNPANDDIKAEIANLKGGSTTSEKGEWKSAMGPYQFEACVKIDVNHVGTPEERANSNLNALGCVRCLQANPLEACKNCGNQAYSFGIDQYGVIGLFCTNCKRGFTSWKCVCGTVNPVSSETLLAKGKSGGCFIATAACGDINSPEVLYLSTFRDDVLRESTFGRTLVTFYYRVSPCLAGYISKSVILRALARILIIRPIIFLIHLTRNLFSWARSE